MKLVIEGDYRIEPLKIWFIAIGRTQTGTFHEELDLREALDSREDWEWVIRMGPIALVAELEGADLRAYIDLGRAIGVPGIRFMVHSVRLTEDRPETERFNLSWGRAYAKGRIWLSRSWQTHTLSETILTTPTQEK